MTSPVPAAFPATVTASAPPPLAPAPLCSASRPHPLWMPSPPVCSSPGATSSFLLKIYLALPQPGFSFLPPHSTFLISKLKPPFWTPFSLREKEAREPMNSAQKSSQPGESTLPFVVWFSSFCRTKSLLQDARYPSLISASEHPGIFFPNCSPVYLAFSWTKGRG